MIDGSMTRGATPAWLPGWPLHALGQRALEGVATEAASLKVADHRAELGGHQAGEAVVVKVPAQNPPRARAQPTGRAPRPLSPTQLWRPRERAPLLLLLVALRGPEPQHSGVASLVARNH